MAEEKNIPETTDLGTDDLSALSYLLQQVKGISSVAGTTLNVELSDDESAA